MSIRKLWNSIRGKSTTSEIEPTTGPVTEASAPETPKPRHEPKIGPRKTPRANATRDDKKLFRQIESLSVQSLLEVTVGEGKRSLAMLQKLTHRGHSTPIHYIAIDEFEMGGGPLSLREFHKQLREYPAKAHLVPMSIDAGLDRVVRTYGQVDIIVWSAPKSPSLEQLETIERLSKPTTVMYTQQEGRWIESNPHQLSGNRAA